MNYQYVIQGKLFRNLGDGVTIRAGDVTLEQGPELKVKSSLGEGWSFNAGLDISASDDQIAMREGQTKIESFLSSMSLVGRDDLEHEALLDPGNAISFRQVGTPGSVIIQMRMLYGAAAMEPAAIKQFEASVQNMHTALASARPNVRLAARWYRISLLEELPADRFMKHWVALDVLVPLGSPPREFDNFKGRAIQFLKNNYPREAVDGLFNHLYHARKGLFHEGDLGRVTHEDAEKLRKLVRSLILKTIGLSALGTLPAGFF